MSRGRPARLPIENPSWIPYAAALKAAADRSNPRWQSRSSTEPFAASAVRCKIERFGKPPELRV